MKNILIVTLIFFGSTSLLSAQSAREEVYPDQVSINHNDAVRQFSRLFVTDFFSQGGFNRDAAELVGDSNRLADVGIYGNNNTIGVAQLGLYNYADVGIFGNNNSIDIMQDGTNLAASLQLYGVNNEFDLTQRGINNIYIGLLEISNTILSRTQTGPNNYLFEAGSGSFPLEITQTGESMRLYIEHNN